MPVYEIYSLKILMSLEVALAVEPRLAAGNWPWNYGLPWI
jgi:hypothetical protein